MSNEGSPEGVAAAGGAPPVVAVVVTRSPGDWFEELLASLAAQDYPNLSVLVVHRGTDAALTGRVAAVLPGAFVRDVAGNRGAASAANDVLSVVEGASHFLFCHDDVALAPDVVRVMVEEAFRSNAGVVGPKLVEWSRPERLLAVGIGVDKLAAASSVVEQGELDQEQHDAVRDVFASPGACLLVRSDLFTTLEGFDPLLVESGADIDLCWRAQIAGARVVVAPGARVRHLETTRHALRSDQPDRATLAGATARNRLRTVFKCYGPWHLLRVVPQAVILGLAELVWSACTGNGVRARAVVGAWTWNLNHAGDLRAARGKVQASRATSDGEVRRLQARGSARLANFLRDQLSGEGGSRSVGVVGRGLAGSLREGSYRLPLAVWIGTVAVVLFGSRELLFHQIPGVRQLAPFPDGPGPLLREFLSGWRATGLGRMGPNPASFALLGLGGTVLLGGMGLLRQVLILGCLAAGAAGAFRLSRPLGSRRARLATVVIYLAVPVAYNALARGRWGGLLMYAAAPFVLRRLCEVTGLPPFTAGGPIDTRRLASRAAPLGILVALLAAFVPMALLVVPLLGVALLLGSLLAGPLRSAVRGLALALLGTVVAAGLLFPWTFEVLGSEWAAFSGVAGPDHRAFSLGDVLRFHTGPIGGSPLGWAFLVLAALPLFIGRDWRLGWAIRMWAVAVVCWTATWVTSQGWIGIPVASPEVFLAPAAVAVALCAGLGAAAFELDLRDNTFGWRQVVTVVAGIAAVASAIPVILASGDGRWHLPEQDYAHLLAWMPAGREAGDFRVLWIGDPGVLPLDGWQLGPGLAYATSRGGTPDVTDLWPGSSSGATRLLADAVDLARRGQTTEVGHLLGPMAVRYIALPVRAAPGPDGGPISPIPADLQLALQSQLDLKQVESDPAIQVYENVAWVPARASLPPASAAALDQSGAGAARTAELAGSPPVLNHKTGPASYRGPLDGDSLVYVAEGGSSHWRLHVDGHSVARRPAFGWASSYQVGPSGPGSLAFATPAARYAAVLVELVLWALAVREVARQRRRRHRVEVDISAASTAVEALSVDAVAAGVEAAELGASP